MTKVNLDTLVARAGAVLPSLLLRVLLRVALGRSSLALCLHRVGAQRRVSEWQPELTIEPEKLDRLIGLLLSTRPGAVGRWLTVTFDDGYQDAVRYVRERSGRFPTVEFLVFVCPEKSEHQAGYRWDEVEAKTLAGVPLEVAQASFEAPLQPERENRREELRALARLEAFGLADPKLLGELTAAPNVFLGNHTNTHFQQTRLTPAQSAEEYQRSRADFERLFGEQRHFAFPFGTPSREFNGLHVEQLRGSGRFLIWSTEPRPYQPQERASGAVLPRFPVNGTLTGNGIAAWIAARAVYFRLKGPRHTFPHRGESAPPPDIASEGPPAL